MPANAAAEYLFSSEKARELGRKYHGDESLHPDYLRTNPVVSTRSGRCFAQCFSLSALDCLINPLLVRLTYRVTCPPTYH